MEEALPYRSEFAHEPPYKKNVSIKRLLSHRKFAKNVRKILDREPIPDLIYCAIPSLDVGKVAADYCRDNNIPFIIDIQDIWPEAFHLVFDVPIISNIVFAPMYKTANYIYNSADQIIAVSQTYVDLALKSSSVPHGHSVYLGTDLRAFDKSAKNGIIKKPENEIWISYIGTLGHSYNIECIIDAIHEYNMSDHPKVKFVVMGDGPLQDKFVKYARSKNVDVWFTGRLPYDKMIAYLAVSDIAVNPINKGAAQSIINKVGDYASAGLPVINTQENREYRNAVEEYNFGINCENDDISGIVEAIVFLVQNKKLRLLMGQNNRKYAEEKFDRTKTYKNISDIIDKKICCEEL